MFHPNEKQNGTLVHVDRLSAYEHTELPKNPETN
jgi:hypothetical protein